MRVDLVILGSGFGGSLCALIADRIGLKTVLIDRATHPRFAIGESSTPTADMILRDLALRYDLPRLTPLSTWGSWRRTYPDVLGGIKRGFSYFRHVPGQRFRPTPEHETELLVAASTSDDLSDTQWYRADVDAFLAEEVRRAGITFMEGVTVDPVRGSNGWRFESVDVEADFVIDASGSGGALSDVEGAGSGPPMQTRTRAVFSHFTGVGRWSEELADLGARVGDYPFDPDHAALHHVIDGGWMWMLRFANDVVSAGLVLDMSAPGQPGSTDTDPRAVWEAHLARYPSIRDLFAGARLAASPGRLVATPLLQRRVARAAGANWAMLPHTAGFVDPLHSTGIAHTLSGVERLTAALESHWGRPTLREAMEGYQQSVLDELAWVDGLVSLCYRSLDSFERWTASAMPYFAAATTYERERADGRHLDRGFLLADDNRLVDVVRRAHLRQDHEVTEYASWLEDMLEPYNRVGLFRPPIPNMYEHTAARKVSENGAGA